MPPVKPRYQTLAAANEAALSDDNLRRLQIKMNEFFYDTLGIEMQPDGSAPNSGVIFPRIMIMGQNQDGADFPQNVNFTNFKPGSKEFLEQVQLGNVFAYPAGKTKPVQVQIKYKNGDAAFTCSDPVEPENIPEPPQAPRPLTGWRWLVSKMFRLPFKAQREAYERYERERANARTKLQEIESHRSEIAAQEEQDYKAEKERRELENEVASAKRLADELTNGKKHFVDTFQPVPHKNPEMIKNSDNSPLGLNYGFYTEKQFRDLTILTSNEDDVKKQHREQDKQLEQDFIRKAREKGVPENQFVNLHPDQQAGGKPYQFRKFDQKSILIKGKPVTNAQFAAVALASCFKIENVAKGHMVDPKQFDPHLEQSVKDMGFSDKEAKMIAHLNFRSMGTTDLFIAEPRDGEGALIKDYTNPSRLEAADAFEAYKNGKKEHLAKLIAHGINEISRESVDQASDHISVQSSGAIAAGEQLLSLMEQDPELAALAAENGMEPDRCECVQGLVKVQKLEEQARQAEYQILKAKLDGNPLTKEQKKTYAEQIVNYKLCMQQLMAHNSLVAEGPDSKYMDFLTKVTPNMQNPPKDPNNVGFPLPKHMRQAPPKGKIYSDSLADAVGGVKMLYAPMPKFIRQLSSPTNEQKVLDFSKKVVADEHVEDLSDAEFYQKIKLSNGTLKLSDHLVKLNEIMAPQNANVRSQNARQNELKNGMEPVAKEHGNPQPGLQPHA